VSVNEATLDKEPFWVRFNEETGMLNMHAGGVTELQGRLIQTTVGYVLESLEKHLAKPESTENLFADLRREYIRVCQSSQ